MSSQADIWDAETQSFRSAPGGVWRDYCDALHLDLLRRWLPGSERRILKTDLFDEAAGTGILDGFADDDIVFGIDISPGVAVDAESRSPGLKSIVGDLRRLPFGDASFDTIVSNSSLDHFSSAKEITDTLRELHRVLDKDGLILVTLDNPCCYAVFLRSLVPYRVLRRLGILKYPVGASFGLRRLCRELSELGFVVEKSDLIMHVPRVVAIPVCARADGSDERTRSRIIRLMLRAEGLARLPIRQVSGHFVAVLAKKAS